MDSVPRCGFRWREAPQLGEGHDDVWRTCVLDPGHDGRAHEPDPDAPGVPIKASSKVAASSRS